MIKGEVHLIFRDVNTGEITKEHKQNNVVTEWGLGYSAGGASQTDGSGAADGDWGRWGWNIYIGNWDQPTDRTYHLLHDIYSNGSTETGISQPRLLSGNIGEGGTFAYYYEYQQRFTPPAATRTIRVIGIQREDHGLGNIRYQKGAECLAMLALSTPCTQTPTETLDVFYRIIWNNPDPVASGVSNTQMQILAQRHMNNDTQSGNLPPTGSVWRVEWPSRWIEYFYHGSKMVPNVGGEILASAHLGLRGSTGMAAYHGGANIRHLDSSLTISDSLGRIYGAIAHRDNTSHVKSAFWNPVIRDFNVDSPVGNIFPHSPAATGPFYQSAGLAVGSGTVTIDGSGWTNPDFNKLLQIEITQTGVLGASEYRVHAMRTTGFLQNTYNNAEVSIPWFNDLNTFDGASLFKSGAGNQSFIEDRGPHMMPYDRHPTEIIVFAHDWIGKGDIMNGERLRFHSGSTPAFNGTDINQIVTVPTVNPGSLVSGDIWVADETGLYRIYEDDSTIQHFDDTHPDLTGLNSGACYGVTFTPGRIWAAFDGGLAFTSDNGANFTVYNGASSPTFTVAEWDRIWFIQGSPTDVNHQIGVAYNEESSHLTTGRCDLKLDWWDSVGGFGNTITSFHRTTSISLTNPWRRLDIFRVFECAPDGSIWGCSHHQANSNNPAFFASNTTAASQTFPSYSSATMNQRYFFGWAKDLAGVYAMDVCWYDFTNFYFGFCQQDGTSTRSDVCNNSQLPTDSGDNWINRAGDEGLKCITPSGMVICSTIDNSSNGAYKFYSMRPAWQEDDDPYGGVAKHLFFDEYGWNGAAWVKDHPGNKPTHASADAFIEGLTISFDDNAGADPFQIDDYYTVAITDGIMADGATEFDHKYCLYYKKVLFGETDVQGAGILPAFTTDFSHVLDNTEKDSLIDSFGVSASGGYMNGSSNNWYARVNHTHTDEAELVWRMDGGVSYGEVYIGFADAAKIGTTPITGTDIDFGIKLSAGVLGGYDGRRVEAVSNGVVALVIDDGSQGFVDDSLTSWGSTGHGNFNGDNQDLVYFKLRREPGSTEVKVYYRNKHVHSFAGASMDLVASFRCSSSSMDVRNDRMRTTLTDRLIELGNSTGPTGFFDPNFYRIDMTTPGRPRADEVLINGTPVTTILYDDITTVLGAGEVSILYQGYVRFSAADVGKTLTVGRYNVMLNE